MAATYFLSLELRRGTFSIQRQTRIEAVDVNLHVEVAGLMGPMDITKNDYWSVVTDGSFEGRGLEKFPERNLVGTYRSGQQIRA